MDFNVLLRNRGVRRVLVGVPDAGGSIAARIETNSGDVITLEESTLAALARAYLQVSTHPTRAAVELVATQIEGGKDGFGPVQLVETNAPEASVRSELAGGPPSVADVPGPVDTGTGTSGIFSGLQDLVEPATRPTPGLATEHGRPPRDDDDELDLELDDPEEEPIFGDVPTHHSKPRKR